MVPFRTRTKGEEYAIRGDEVTSSCERVVVKVVMAVIVWYKGRHRSSCVSELRGTLQTCAWSVRREKGKAGDF